MFTEKQEDYLGRFADLKIAEEEEIEARNATIDLDGKISTAREARLAELKIEAQELIDAGLLEFEETEVPKIK